MDGITINLKLLFINDMMVLLRIDGDVLGACDRGSFMIVLPYSAVQKLMDDQGIDLIGYVTIN